MCGCLLGALPTRDMACDLGMCPDRVSLESNWQHSGLQACAQSTELQQPGTVAHFVIGVFVFLEWNPVSSLNILEIKPLSEILFANIFSHTVGSLFI